MSSGYQAQGAAQSPQDQGAPSNANTIPLVCYICPKNSHFSDLSHLLTHISSKGHLHNVFQLTLTRDVDENAALALAEYENWFAQNHIGALLRARKTAREQRDSQQRQNQSSLSHGADNVETPRMINRGGRSNRRGRGSLKTDNRDRLGIDVHNDDMMKFESDDNDEAQQGSEYRSINHTPYVWHPGSIYPNNSVNHFPDYLEDEDDSSKYEASEQYSPFPPEDTPETVEDDTGALILKGVVYPGMAGFDSATEKDRRMRNQKKDPAVLLKLETNSQQVTRIEEVLDINLDYQRTRDVYDEPSIDGSGDDDDDDDVVNQPRTKRRTNQAKSSYASAKRANARSRQQTRTAGKTRGTRSSGRRGRGPSRSNIAQSSVSRRITRSSANRQEQLPLHNHGVHPDMATLRDCNDMDDDEGWQMPHGLIGQCLMTPWQVFEPMFIPPSDETSPSSEPPLSPEICDASTRSHDHLQGLALRPGNPNVAFASPTPGFKKSPPRYSGKENHHLLIKSPSAFNPYLHPSGDSIETNSYNPLCPQPGDGFGYRLYSPYDEEHKQPSSSGFNPINNTPTYDSAHVPGVVGNSYHHSQHGGDDYPL
ncbi:hypothetical protein GGS21DRAFT_543029 [Xylaria nigripes]|nr:hypothetical protein GGS21DRAFT_543029 [Xylaria nigripes]